MKNILPKTIYQFLFTIICFNGFSQDIHFSQFFEAPLLRNPALAGIFSGDFRIEGIYRSQWGSVTVPYQTGSLGIEDKIAVGHANDFISFGGEILYDKAGTVALTATQVLPVFNFHKSLSDEKNMYLSAGFMAGIVQRKLDPSKITTNSQYNGTAYDPTLSNGENFSQSGYSYFDGSAGLSFNSQLGENEDNNIFLGIAYHHFNKSAKVSFYSNSEVEMIPKLTFSAGIRLSATDYSYITLQGDFSKQGPSTEEIGGVLYSYKLDEDDNPKYIIHGGGFLRWRDAFIPVAKLEVRPFSFGVSYDVNISQLKAASSGRGGFELSVSYQKYLDKDNSSKEAVRCPRF